LLMIFVVAKIQSLYYEVGASVGKVSSTLSLINNFFAYIVEH